MRATSGIVLLACLCGGIVLAAPSKNDVVALAGKGAQLVKLHGRVAMLAKIEAHDRQFKQGAPHLVMRGMNGITTVHPSMTLIGKSLMDVPDAGGKPLRQQMLALARDKGRGWIGYKVRNRETGKVQASSSYVAARGRGAGSGHLPTLTC